MSHPLDDSDWRPAYAWVELKARGILDPIPEGVTISTTLLAKEIEKLVDGPSEARLKRIFNGLKAMATRTLQRYNSPGEPIEIAGKKRVPRVWHRPGVEIIPPAKKCCKECGRPL